MKISGPNLFLSHLRCFTYFYLSALLKICVRAMSWTVWNFFMKVHRWVYLNQAMCCEREYNSLFYFLSYPPLPKIRVRAINPEPYGISSWNFTDGFILTRRCIANKEVIYHYFSFRVICPCWKSVSGPSFLKLQRWIYNNEKCVAKKEDTSCCFHFQVTPLARNPCPGHYSWTLWNFFIFGDRLGAKYFTNTFSSF